MKPLTLAPGRVGQVLADDAARVGEAVRETRRLGIEQQARRLAAARRQHDDARAHLVFGERRRCRRTTRPSPGRSASVITSRAIAFGTIVSLPVLSAGGSITDTLEKFACVAQPRPHWPQ